MGVILRHAGIGRRDVEQPLHQIDDPAEQRQKDQHPNHDGRHDPDCGDRRPAADIPAVAEGGDVDEHDQRDDEERRQRDRQDDLPHDLLAMFEIGFANGLREGGFHVIYFSTRPDPSALLSASPKHDEPLSYLGEGRVGVARLAQARHLRSPWQGGLDLTDLLLVTKP